MNTIASVSDIIKIENVHISAWKSYHRYIAAVKTAILLLLLLLLLVVVVVVVVVVARMSIKSSYFMVMVQWLQSQ